MDPRHAPRTAAPGGASGGKLPWPAPPPPPRGRWRVWAGTYLPWALTGVVITIGAAAIAALWPSGRGGKVPDAATSSPSPALSAPAAQSPQPLQSPQASPRRRHWVDTFADAEGYREPGDGRPVGVLRRGTHYVFCKAWGPRRERRGAYNHWWLLTDLDEVYAEGDGARAWVPALYLTRWGNDEARDNDGREIPTCGEGEG
ncbi:hypothetical protein [Thermomonospora catenispora]|uniref:hypothetical protein n=1 Tax=Thermomonospora catenispora TaxID=2493090 RepID=UPI0013756182|nr:hypothetical protein [Thermomonospora catenispora]